MDNLPFQDDTKVRVVVIPTLDLDVEKRWFAQIQAITQASGDSWSEELIHERFPKPSRFRKPDFFLTSEELKQIRHRCEKATPGPSHGENIELTGATVADQDFIAQARQDIPRLLAEIERLRGLISKLKTPLASVEEVW